LLFTITYKVFSKDEDYSVYQEEYISRMVNDLNSKESPKSKEDLDKNYSELLWEFDSLSDFDNSNKQMAYEILSTRWSDLLELDGYEI
jgi:hypothetical protein